MSKRSATAIWYLDGKVVQRYRSSNIRRFSSKLSLGKFLRSRSKVYIRLSYGRQKDHRGKLVDFYNEGTYTTKKEMLKAYRAFIEE